MPNDKHTRQTPDIDYTLATSPIHKIRALEKAKLPDSKETFEQFYKRIKPEYIDEQMEKMRMKVIHDKEKTVEMIKNHNAQVTKLNREKNRFKVASGASAFSVQGKHT